MFVSVVQVYHCVSYTVGEWVGYMLSACQGGYLTNPKPYDPPYTDSDYTPASH